MHDQAKFSFKGKNLGSYWENVKNRFCLLTNYSKKPWP